MLHCPHHEGVHLDDNRLFERMWESAFVERIIYQFGNRWEEYIKTILKEECWYRVQ